MTADARVGLLLGLVFIVLIAFMVNSLPNFFHDARAEAPLQTRIPDLGTVVIDAPTSAARSDARRPPVRAGRDAERVVLIPPPATTVRAEEPTTAPTVSQRRLHTVKKGETLTTIAVQAYGRESGKKRSTHEAIAKANSLKSLDALRIGQVLVLPDLDGVSSIVSLPSARQADNSGRGRTAPAETVYIEHKVRAGESLSGISQRYLGSSRRVDEILAMNRQIISDANKIKAGMVIKLPQK